MNLNFIVSCGHRDVRWQRNNLPVTASIDSQGEGAPDRYYVSMSGFGCSKSYSTPERAILCMLQDHACFDILVRPVPSDTPELAEHRLRGQMDRLDGKAAIYGCHVGMRSTRNACNHAYHEGWTEIDEALALAPTTPVTAHDIACAMAEAIVPATRQDGTNYWKLADGSPEWMATIVRKAHCGMLPNDFRYEAIMRAVRFLADDAVHCDLDNDAVAEVAAEHIDSLVATSTSVLAEWLASHPTRAGYVDDAAYDLGTPAGTGISDRLQAGQRAELEEVFATVQRFLQRRERELTTPALPCVG